LRVMAWMSSGVWVRTWFMRSSPSNSVQPTMRPD